ncbi:MAG: GIY-YIG nuclease family protein [Actinobacteria bacterium]|nr:GIY-YIG nuclease family protein [Actinomycetota bacterium]
MNAVAERPYPHTIPDGLPSGHVVNFVEGAGLIKIGIAFDLADRIRKMQAQCPVPLTVVLAVPGRGFMERELHREFAEYRRQGEWFAMPEDWRERVDAWVAAWQEVVS